MRFLDGYWMSWICILLLKYDGILLDKNRSLLNANHQDSKQQEKSMYGAVYTP
jgi:hypothetical protein